MQTFVSKHNETYAFIYGLSNGGDIPAENRKLFILKWPGENNAKQKTPQIKTSFGMSAKFERKCRYN